MQKYLYFRIVTLIRFIANEGLNSEFTVELVKELIRQVVLIEFGE